MKNRMSSVVLAGVLAAVCAVGVGCELSPEREKTNLVQAWTAETQPMTTVEVEGDYVLFVGTEDVIIARNYLKAGAQIGFTTGAKDADGKAVGTKSTVSAIAGDLVVPIDTTKVYEWRYIPGSTAANKTENPYWPRP